MIKKKNIMKIDLKDNEQLHIKFVIYDYESFIKFWWVVEL